jgi:ABC-type multidrug transport system ATPase subunit
VPDADGDPDLIMIDEPTEGLAPKIVELVAEYLKELKNREFRCCWSSKISDCTADFAAGLCHGTWQYRV